MHWIRRHILHRLSTHQVQRYSELKPEDIEGNLFMYHLGALVRDGLVVKRSGGYGLSAAGKRWADRLSFKTLRPRIQPKIVTMVVCRDKSGRWLLYRRRRQPFTGLISFPHGKVHLGESLDEAATRELKEKAGLGGSVRRRGEVTLRVFEGDELISHVICHVFGASAKGTITPRDEPGGCFWSKLPIKGDRYAPGFSDIKRLTERGGDRFFREFTYHL